MSLATKQLTDLTEYFRTKTVSMFDPAVSVVEPDTLRASFAYPHKGFYVGIIGSDDTEYAREGFLRDDLTNVLDTADLVSRTVYATLKAKNIPENKIRTSSFHYAVVTGVDYTVDPLAWDEGKDGVYMQWGQDYRGLYLPYQIKRLGLPKVEIMDRLCCWQCGLSSSLWQTPEGLIWRLTVQSF